MNSYIERKNKFREYVSRDYSKFNIEKLLEIIKVRFENCNEFDINLRANTFVQNLEYALNKIALKKILKIPLI